MFLLSTKCCISNVCSVSVTVYRPSVRFTVQQGPSYVKRRALRVGDTARSASVRASNLSVLKFEINLLLKIYTIKKKDFCI